ncbi:MAG TPA: hypothetical protein VGR37_16865 [Longimicrobiaceae bacterium]|nr:hypothetical protein [Longimicrobiaceae bacterium]
MNLLRLLLGGAAIATILVAFRDFDHDTWLPPGGRAATGLEGEEDEEPILGYDGMDRDMLIQWIRDAQLDEDTLIRIHEYEAANQRRDRVMQAVSELLGG